ncbi:hypothetical protein F66182_16480 [Fusarium sp. NRRL 66182]|nr:hypothetical protein F66182_16480 [Fusarium sp. NRRL 66182]
MDDNPRPPTPPSHDVEGANSSRRRRWQDSIQCMKIFSAGSVKRTWRTPFGFHLSDVAVSSSRDIQLTDLGIEVELSGSSYIFEGVPRRVREHLAPEKGKTICGWGLWIEEDFIIKWYFLFLINVPAIVLLCVGIYESTRHGLTLLAVDQYSNALYAAAERGHLDIIQQLLKKGANVNAQGGFYGNALQAAAQGGHLDIVQ